ncbi:MAG: DUF4175 family protein [Rhizomicrobium sp.]
MTRYSDPNEFRTGSRAERTERYVLASRAALLWERAWPALWPASGIAGLFAGAALFDAFAPLPWTLHALILSGTITAIGLALYFGFREMGVPDWMEGARRLEKSSALKHRPISEAGDRMALGQGDALAEELWKLHVRQALAGIGRLRLAWPAPGLARRDPRALRFAVLLLLAAGIAMAGSDSLRRLMAGFGDSGAAASASVDAWIDPPPYTGEPPVYLARGMTLAVPAGSTLNLRVHGAGHLPGLSVDSDADGGAGFSGAHGEYAATVIVAADAHVRVRSAGRAIGDWTITAIPDKPPSIAFAAAPAKTEHQVLKLSYKASDDYGVAAVRAIIRPHNRKGAAIVLDLGVSGGKAVAASSFNDLTAHPYAGLDVDIALQAADGAGHVATTKPVTFRLPSRVFTHPLARALIEQRQDLSTTTQPAERSRIVRALDALTLAPQIFYAEQTGVYMGIRAARWALANAEHAEEIAHVEDLLWQIAVGLERGGLLSAAAELRRLQAVLAQALAQGAPQEVIDELLQRYNDAMQRYMRMLAENPSAAPSDAPPPGTRTLSQQDLQALLKAIQQLAQSGARAQAQQMLALLQNLLENLRLSSGSGGDGSNDPQNKALSDANRALSELMGKQRELLDKTFKGRQGQSVDPKGLEKEQGDIQKRLGDVEKGLGEQHIPVPNDMGRAGRSMGDSGRELGSNDLTGSSIDQKNALDALRSAATELAQRLMKRMGQDSQGETDPLGRSRNGTNLGDDVKVPDAAQMQRARDILLELRRRAAERGRPQQELDYIDRLLKQF